MSDRFGDVLASWWLVMVPGQFDTAVREMMTLVGLALAQGAAPAEVFAGAARQAQWLPMRRALAFIERAVRDGDTLAEAAQEPVCNALPPRFRALLAADLPTPAKGVLIANLAPMPLPPFWKRLGPIVFEITVFLFICSSLVLFVLPQFNDIMTGMRIEKPLLLQIMQAIADWTINWWFLLMPGMLVASPLVIWVLDMINRLGAGTRETVQIMRSLAELPRIDHPAALRAIAHPLVLPATHGLAQRLLACLEQGQPADKPLREAGVDPLVAWTFATGLSGRDSETVAENAAELLMLQHRNRRRRAEIIAEVGLVLTLSCAVLFVTATVFVAMIRMQAVATGL